MSKLREFLKATDYTGSDFYEEHARAGIDYLAYGDWQRAYGRMIAEATLQSSYDKPAVLDAGCACGTHLQGFRETGLFVRSVGVDMSEHMIRMGRAHFGFSDDDLVAGSIETLPVSDGELTLINSGQVLEHVSDGIIDKVFAEFFRALRPGGRMFHNLAALKHGEPPNHHDYDPTHINVKPTLYWAEKFAKAGFLPDFESYDRFARSSESPGTGCPNFFTHYSGWTCFALIKPQTHKPRGRLSLLNLQQLKAWARGA